jgi:ribonuclease Z
VPRGNIGAGDPVVCEVHHNIPSDPAEATPHCGRGATARAPCIFSPMPLTVRFLGTSAARPTVERNVSAIAVVREGETFLFDCGEGTQRQMMRYGITFNVDDIFFTHFHTDHVLGFVGLIRTMTLQGRTLPLRAWGPKGAVRFLQRAELFGGDRLSFPMEVRELGSGDVLKRKEYDVTAFEVEHRGPESLGFALVEHERRGRFNPDRARELGIPEGPLWGRIHRGESVTLPDGREVPAAELVGATRAGRRVVITGDTRPCAATITAAHRADLLVHEATFGEEEAERARETGHSTAREAAQVAAYARARRLVLTHLSARYSRDTSDLEREAREVFPATTVARDGTEVDVPHVDVEADPGMAQVTT